MTSHCHLGTEYSRGILADKITPDCGDEAKATITITENANKDSRIGSRLIVIMSKRDNLC